MVTALVMISVEHNRINEVAQTISSIDGVSEVYSVGGQVDLIAIVRGKDNDEMADIVTDHVLMVDGITSSETMIAFRVYSRHDLESMFSIGM